MNKKMLLSTVLFLNAASFSLRGEESTVDTLKTIEAVSETHEATTPDIVNEHDQVEAHDSEHKEAEHEVKPSCGCGI